MKILILGRLDGWMGLHISHFSDGFIMLGHEITLIDYHSWDRKVFSLYSNEKRRDCGRRVRRITLKRIYFKIRLIWLSL